MIREEDANFRLEKKNRILYVLGMLFLGLYPLRHIFFGTDWWDTGYNYGNFVFMNQMDPMWISGTFLGTALGNLMTKLPFGGTMVGLNFYTGLTLVVLGMGGFWFSVKKLRIPVLFALVGEVLAEFLSWCPTALLYNYLTYVLLFWGCVSLYLGLTKRDKGEGKYFILAGIFLGINVLTRFPNLSEMALIVAVWAMAVLEKKGIGKALQQTGLCILGYGAGLAMGLGIVACSLGIDVYVGGIQRLMDMPGEATDYSLYSMVYSQYENYLNTLKQAGILFLLVLVVFLLGWGCHKLLAEKKGLQRFLPGIVALMGFVGCMIYYYRQHRFSFDYYGKDSYFLFASFFLLLCILLGLYVILWKQFTMEEKLVMGMGILLIFITPLGSNNHLYSSSNNLYFMAPLCIWLLWRAFCYCKEKVWLTGVGEVLVLFLTVLMVQSGLFSATNIFCEAYGGKNLHTKIGNNDILKGIRTSPDRAKEIEDLTAFVEEKGLRNRKLFLYGGIPSMAYYLDMPFVFTSWPDLRSFNKEVLQQNLSELEQRIDLGEEEYPVLLLGNSQGKDLVEAITSKATDLQDEKLILLVQFAEKYQYELQYESDKFVLLTPRQ